MIAWSFVVQGADQLDLVEIREECRQFAAHLKTEFGDSIELSVFTGPEGWGGGSDQDPTSSPVMSTAGSSEGA